jgi:hypothetical protein
MGKAASQRVYPLGFPLAGEAAGGKGVGPSRISRNPPKGHQQESIFESPAQLPRSRPLTPPTFLPPLVAARLRAQSPADSSASASAASADLHGPTLDGRHTEVTEETGGDTETAGNAEPEAARAAKKDDDLASATSFFMFSSAALYAESAPHASNMDR